MSRPATARAASERRPELLADPAAMRAAVAASQAAGRRVGFVPTMGALHDGHLALVDRAAAESADVCVSIFVNPTQFGPGEDFDRYPRTLAADAAALATRRVRWIFAPNVSDIYPSGAATRVSVAGPALRFEGHHRPGHFDGVATVVCRLLHAVPADAAYFGAKDWQQTVVVRRMVADLGLPTEVVVCPTVRDHDGLALSSRNAYLSPDERHRALAIPRGLAEAESGWRAGDPTAAIERRIRETLADAGVAVDYAAIVDAATLEPLHDRPLPAVALVAGRIGATRLIDNREFPPRPGGDRNI